MWLFHPLGFVSIVQNQEKPDTLLVRGRFAGDVERLFPGYAVKVTRDRDYLYRAVVPREAVAARLGMLADDIDYPNFKNAAPKSRSSIYSRVWSIMFNAQDMLKPKRRRRDKGLQNGFSWLLPEVRRS